MDQDKFKLVQDAENFLLLVTHQLVELEKQLLAAKTEPERRKLSASLETKRIKFAQVASDVVIFKARYGIFTNTKKIR